MADASRKSSRPREAVTVFDAVAGRVGYEGFLSQKAPSKNRDTSSNIATAIAPEEVLFRRTGAPVRYEEDDVYAADRHLGPAQQLPDSSLVKALHAYVADFYKDYTEDQGRIDLKSMDETALLAMGILVEEAAREAVERMGHQKTP